MQRHSRRLVLAVLGLLLASISWSRPDQPSVPSVKIAIVAGPTAIRVVVDASAPLAGVTAAYLRNQPSTLAIGLGLIAPPDKPAVPLAEAGLIREARLEMDSGRKSTLILALAEPLPYTLTAEKNRTVVELTRILTAPGDGIPPEIQKELAGADRKPAGLDDVLVTDSGPSVDVTARLGRKPVTNVFALGQPLRLVVDFYDTTFSRPTLTRPVGRSGLARVRVGQFKSAPPAEITRLVFDLTEAGLYRINPGPQDWTISFAPAALIGAPAIAPATSPDKPAAEKPAPKAGLPAGTGQETAKPAPKTEAQAATVAESRTQKPPEKPAEKPAEKPPSEKPAPKPPEQAAVQKTPSKEPPRAQEQAPAEKAKTRTIYDTQEKYSGDLLSPKFKDADLKDVILWLGEKYELNVIFDPDVRGSVTGSWVNVPWDQFLDMILKINKMGKTFEGNVLRIMPLSALAEEERALQQIRDAREQSGPLTTKTYELSYAKAADVLNLMKNRKSARGDIVIDERTNTLIATDVADKIELLDKLIAALDTPTPQVEIQTRIIEATSTFVRNLGIQWGSKGVADPFYGNQTSLQFPNKIAVDGALIPQGTTTRGIGGPLGGYAVNLPASAFNTAVGVSFANVLDSFRLDLALTAMESEGSGRIVSSQRATTLNNKEAYINQGRQIPVQTQANFTVTTQFFNAGLELRATPQITAEGTIIMTIDIQNNAADFANLVNGIPPITTQSAKTTVLVPDGGTTVIGGIYRSEDSITNERVPFLHQIPILGNLFKSLSKTRTNRELLIFITPRIIQ
jgi:type IV pilus secretin PilQ/predicted competence protein